MDELNKLWKEIESADEIKSPTLSLINQQNLSVSEKILRRFRNKINIYAGWNLLLIIILLYLAFWNHENTTLLFVLWLTCLALGGFGFNIYQTRKKINAQSLDLTKDLKVVTKNLLTIIQYHIKIETKLSNVLTPFSVLIGVMLVLSYREIPLENMWKDTELLFKIISATVVITLANFFLTPFFFRKKYEHQVSDLQLITKQMKE